MAEQDSGSEANESDQSSGEEQSAAVDEDLAQILNAVDTSSSDAEGEVDLELFLQQSGLLNRFSSNDYARQAQELENARETRIEELVADCMKLEGFEYSTADPLYLQQYVIDENVDLGERSWVETYGFASSTWLELANGRLPSGVVGMPLDNITQPIDNHPNALYFETLDPAGQLAYLTVLEGDFNSAERTGCRYEAESAIPPIGQYGALLDYESGDALAERVKASAQFVQFERDLVACVRGDGYLDYAGLGSGRTMAEDVLLESGILGPVVDPDDNSIQSSDDISVSIDPESAEYYELLAEVQNFEIALALTVFDCGGSTANQLQLYKSIVEDLASSS